MDKLYEQTMLFDFYGELLTEHQRKIYEDAVYNDLSLSEIAEEQGISRQGVHDLIKRCDKLLLDYESKLHLVERFAKAKEIVKEIQKLAGNSRKASAADKSGEALSADDSGKDDREVLAAEDRLQRISMLSQKLLKEL